MRRFMILVLLAGVLWGGYWFVGKSAKYAAMSAWISERRAAGWTINYSDFRVVGFPNRFDSRFRDLDIYDPVARIGWRAPLFNILALSYQPNHIIAAFAPDQHITTGAERIRVKSSRMMASLVFAPNTKLAVQRITLRAKDLSLISSSGWTSGAKSIAISTRQGKAPFSHEVVFDIKRISPTHGLRHNLDPAGTLPKIIDTIYLDTVLGFNAPWDRLAIEQGAPEVTGIEIRKMQLGWGKLGLAAQGQLQVSKDGTISGRIRIDIRNWRGVLALFRASGVFSANLEASIRTALGLMTAGTSKPDELSLPLTLADGQMSLGPVPLGPAPRFIRN